ncbi:hypothetical protein CLV44_102103 [Marinobacterium halophilum]|uniref:Uncharacterized protein n=1 Tax=Marinobacterium halophilum TaxID=267374 RepID=A0A2P8F389_9GAMM|nr:hypothetical protein [Marinobacterium halophilum]PSL16180.1 hypothetical protein CLV44_102103 [Marinobacterium halophilum]
MIPSEHYLYFVISFTFLGYFLLFIYRRYMSVKYIFFSSLLLGVLAFLFFLKGQIDLEIGKYDLGLIASGFMLLSIYSIVEGFRKIRRNDT